MDAKDDSGIDCEVNEQSKTSNVADINHANENENRRNDIVPHKVFAERSPEDHNSVGQLKKSAEPQKKMEKHRSNLKKINSNLNSQPKGILSRNRLLVPSKSDVASETDIQPLVVIDIDDSEEDEFAMPKKMHKDISQQLNRDGYGLELDPDEDDLDLIPPRPLNERCMCCNTQVNCCIQ